MPDRVLVVDDDLGARETLSRALLDEGFQCVAVEDAKQALDELRRDGFDAVAADIRLPGMSGFELIEHIHALPTEPAVIVITGFGSEQSAVTALRMGATDYLTKPIRLDQFVAAVRHAIERRHATITAKDYQRTLERELRQKTQEVEMTFLSTVKALVVTLEARDKFTINHSKAVSQGATTIGKMLLLSQEELKDLQLAGLLHDIGKVGVRDAVLTKTSSLTPEEFEEVKAHSIIGERIIKPVARFRNIARDIRHHHEWFDGNGYPDRLS
ncbi:MAG: response regulator, partial [Planctomycetes bacterium]|nr:response regulator [Planctomycetota bacterium]